MSKFTESVKKNVSNPSWWAEKIFDFIFFSAVLAAWGRWQYGTWFWN